MSISAPLFLLFLRFLSDCLKQVVNRIDVHPGELCAFRSYNYDRYIALFLFRPSHHAK